ncbi:uracil permease [Microdochium trichocladiopsis]|uniref:Uracil permease n=1 Tax=Microdochium trichocladiopsis TaxID=1682393 RepID=A0A9P8XX46_9PEZI|nr:uracil permease [Microdochium trichocladiopsis]KAH7024451.1 uracil permease [Microdochium trichocladiopsis]
MAIRLPSFLQRRPQLRVEQPKSTFAEGNPRWTNKDLDPVAPADRKWGVTSSITYWVSDAFNAATWQFAASIIATGLTWRESVGIVALSFFIIAIVIAFNGAIGVIHHVPFPVIARASWGFWGSYIAIISRGILAIFWFAIQTMNGANTVRVMIGAIWPSFLTLANHIPEGRGIDDATMISFFIFWLAQVPFLLMHPNQLRYLFMAKTAIVPLSWVAILIWALVTTKDGDIFNKQVADVSGERYSWAFLASMTSVIGNYATLSVNQADFSRYSRVNVRWQLLYVPMLPVFFTFIAFIGIAASSAGGYHYGVIEWDPMALVGHWDNRAARFFAGFSFALAALGVNISANSLSAANDLMALAPRFINIRRGQLICAVMCWALVPWEILKSAGSFLNFMAAYAIFLGPIASIMLFDFWVLHRRKYDTLALYDAGGIYRYSGGVNWRAVVAFLAGVAPSLPGFIHTINPAVEVGVGVHPYEFGWLLGFVGTAAVYMGLSLAFPSKPTFIERAVRPDEVFAANGSSDEVGEQPGGYTDDKQGSQKFYSRFV